MKAKALIFSLFSMFLLIVFTGFTFLLPKMKLLDESSSKEKFEGKISFTKKIGSKESKYNYIVKGNQVRIEEFDKEGKISGVMLVNTEKNTVTALNPLRKMYMSVPNDKKMVLPVVEVSKKETTKSYNGYNCKEWEVSSKDQDRVITYYLAFDNFHFLSPLLKTLNRRDKQATFFLALSGAEGAFPMLSIEKKSDGTEISRLTVNSISKSSVEASQFEIPGDYTNASK